MAEQSNLNLDALEDFNITLSNNNGSKQMNLIGQLLALSIYESIFQTLMTCEIVLADAIALAHDFPIIGEEVVEIEFRTRNTKKISKYKFFIHSLEDVAVSNINRQKTYMLRGVSIEAVADARVVVQQTYLAPIDQIAEDIIKNYLRSEKPTRFSKTEGILKVNIPSLSPLKALEMLRQQAVCNEFKYSPYFVFETASEFSFVDIASSFKEATAALIKNTGYLVENARVYYPPHMTKTNPLSRTSWQNIVALEQVTSHDSITKTHTGTYYSKLQKFDLLSKQYEEVETKLSDFYRSADLLNGPARFNTDDFVQQLSDQGSVQYLVFTDASRPKIPIDFLPQKSAFATLLFQNITRIELHGDSSLEAGQALFLRIIKSTGTTSLQDEDADMFLSGFYMINKLAHHITLAAGEPSMRTSCEIVKGSNMISEGELKGVLQ